MMKEQVYKGVTTVRAVHSTIELAAESRRWRPWEDFMPWAAVSALESNGEGEPVAQVEGKVLRLQNAKAVVHVPFSRRTTLEIQDHSEVTGRCSAGRIDCDASSHVRIDIPFRYRHNLGPMPSTLLALLEDAVYVALTCLILAAAGGSLVKLFGGAPQSLLGIYAIIAAGAYVGIRGSQKRALLFSIAIATICIFGPEAKAVVTEGFAEALGMLDIEDLGKVILWAATFSLGAAARRHYLARTA